MHFEAKPCDETGNFLPFGALPEEDEPGASNNTDWYPFNDRLSFEFARFAFSKAELSAGDENELLEIWAAHNTLHGDEAPRFSTLKNCMQLSTVYNTETLYGNTSHFNIADPLTPIVRPGSK